MKSSVLLDWDLISRSWVMAVFGSMEIDDYNDDATPLLLTAFSPLLLPIPGNNSHT